jgi:inositol oxygenase
MSKLTDEFRNYTTTKQEVTNVYQLNHENQTVEFVRNKLDQYCRKFDKCQMTLWDAISKLDKIIDESDPDLNSSQILHAFQTAEGIRKNYPEYDWLHLVGLIHDLGKVLLLPEFGSLQQWEVVGDTFPVGCKFSDKIVYHDFFKNNPDTKNFMYDNKFGIYYEGCGLKNVLFSFSHDEYLYRVLVHNKCTIPEIGLNIIRYHSFYPWHKNNAYDYLDSVEDQEIKNWCKIFSECDLYTKDDNNKIDIENVMPYYQSLVEKYFPNQIISW